MKTKTVRPLAIILFLFVALVSCDELQDEMEEKDTLYVKFENSSSSEYTITGIRLLVMGKAGQHDEPDGVFGPNILEAGTTIAPGTHQFFTLEIPNLYYAYYRLTVDDGTGNQVYLFDQEAYTNTWDGTITHWGGDDRTVSATIVWNDDANIITVSGWSDWVGID